MIVGLTQLILFVDLILLRAVKHVLVTLHILLESFENIFKKNFLIVKVSIANEGIALDFTIGKHCSY